jgi:hypothetical protein
MRICTRKLYSGITNLKARITGQLYRRSKDKETLEVIKLINRELKDSLGWNLRTYILNTLVAGKKDV